MSPKSKQQKELLQAAERAREVSRTAKLGVFLLLLKSSTSNKNFHTSTVVIVEEQPVDEPATNG